MVNLPTGVILVRKCEIYIQISTMLDIYHIKIFVLTILVWPPTYLAFKHNCSNLNFIFTIIEFNFYIIYLFVSPSEVIF